MTLDWTAFTPGAAALGGALIGLAAAAMWLVLGRVAGVSGIVGSLLSAATVDRAWRLAFVGGLVAAPWAYALVAPLPVPRIDATVPLLALAGFLVGIGTRYAGGCTSGHGVCGTARFSRRSLVATACFMGAGFATVFVVRHLLG